MSHKHIGRMVAATMAACIASVALVGSPALAEDAQLESSDAKPALCTPPNERGVVDRAAFTDAMVKEFENAAADEASPTCEPPMQSHPEDPKEGGDQSRSIPIHIGGLTFELECWRGDPIRCSIWGYGHGVTCAFYYTAAGEPSMTPCQSWRTRT